MRIKVHLSVVNAPIPPPKKGTRSRLQKESKESQFQLSFEELDPLFTFPNFVPGEENRLTYQILHETAELSCSNTDQAKTCNPIYIYGPEGSGKTHLLMSLASSFIAKNLKTMYVRAELFTDHVVAAIRAGEMSTFRQAYRNTDILIVDDVHIFSQKERRKKSFSTHLTPFM